MTEINTVDATAANATTQPPLSNQTEYDANYWQAVRMTTAEWIVAECLSIITTCFAVYLVVSLMYFEMGKRGIFISTKRFESEYSSTEVESSSKTSPSKTALDPSPKKKKKANRPFKVMRKSKPSHEEKYEIWLRALNLNAAFFAALKCFSAQMDLIWGTQEGKVCTAYAFTTVIFNGSSYLSMYLLLWLRQWAVHSHPALQHLPVKILRRTSWILLVAILVTFAALCVLFFVTLKVTYSARGCMFADVGTISQGARSGSGIIFTAFFQPALLALLCYPLMKHTLSRREAFGIGTAEKGVAITKPRDAGEAKIYRIIRRLIFSVMLCIISDIGAVIGAFLLELHPIYYIGIVYDVNITFGAYVIAWSFNNWRQRLLPFCTKPKHQNGRAQEGTNAVTHT